MTERTKSSPLSRDDADELIVRREKRGGEEKPGGFAVPKYLQRAAHHPPLLLRGEAHKRSPGKLNRWIGMNRPSQFEVRPIMALAASQAGGAQFDNGPMETLLCAADFGPCFQPRKRRQRSLLGALGSRSRPGISMPCQASCFEEKHHCGLCSWWRRNSLTSLIRLEMLA